MHKFESTLVVPVEHPCFADHFPGNPIVPGALLLQWIFEHIKLMYTDLCIIEVKSAKFLHTLAPGAQCELSATLQPEQNTLKVSCQSQNKIICHCKLLVETRHGQNK